MSAYPNQRRLGGTGLYPARSRRAFSLIEVLVVVGILAILMGLLVPVVAGVRKSRRSVQCVNNLRGISSAIIEYTVEHQGRFPDPGTADKSWEQMLLPNDALCFRCLDDNELFPSVGSSYDWRDTGDERTTLAGKLLADVQRPGAVMVLESLPGWHEKGRIHAARIDGSVSMLDDVECIKDLTVPIR